MRWSSHRGWLLAAMVFVAALAGVIVGRTLVDPRPTTANSLHEVLHDELGLTSEQEAHISKLESDFALRRRALELELQACNARLAEAMEAEHGYGPRVRAVVDQSHKTMGELQKQTLSHMFAMRAVLTPDQARRFDHAVTQALTADQK
jgi:nickel and cobalt resistance protein CnrR